MNRSKLPVAPEDRPCAGVQSEISPKALDRWNPAIHAAAGDDADNTITIYDPIGYDFWTGDGVTAKRIAGALRAIGNETDVIVNINSPGGDVFEGLAIYNLLREHKGKVTVNVMGIAASAASFIAMAADELRIGRAAFFMIHNGWVMAVGNRNDLRDVADWLEPFDKTIADIYVTRTGLSMEEVQAQMDTETWIGGQEAVAAGWADALLESDEVTERPANEVTHRIAARQVDTAMARAGLPRSQRRTLINALKTSTHTAAGGGTQDAAMTDTHDAVAPDLSASLNAVNEIIANIGGRHG